MTEEPLAGPGAVPVRTGIESVDSVLDLVAGLDQRPLGDHAAVFEAAHTELRRPLEQPGPAER